MENNVKCIIALTSFTKSRMKLLPKYLFESIFRYRKPEYKVVLTLYKEDLADMSEELKLMIDSDIIELIVADKNLKSHLKYFYVMQKYRNLPIITIDDDKIYPVKMFDYMLEEHYKNPTMVLCRSCQQFTYTNHKINNTEKWLHTPQRNISHINHAEGYAGVLYPPDCLNVSNALIPEIESCIKSDDIYLSVLEIRNGMQVYYLPKMRHEFVLSTKGENSISLTKDIVKINNGYVKMFESVFNKVG